MGRDDGVEAGDGLGRALGQVQSRAERVADQGKLGGSRQSFAGNVAEDDRVQLFV